jgi:hypothetical protein
MNRYCLRRQKAKQLEVSFVRHTKLAQAVMFIWLAAGTEQACIQVDKIDKNRDSSLVILAPEQAGDFSLNGLLSDSRGSEATLATAVQLHVRGRNTNVEQKPGRNSVPVGDHDCMGGTCNRTVLQSSMSHQHDYSS